MLHSKIKFLSFCFTFLFIGYLSSLEAAQTLKVINKTKNYIVSIHNIKVFYSVSQKVETENYPALQNLKPGTEGEITWYSGWLSWEKRGRDEGRYFAARITVYHKDDPNDSIQYILDDEENFIPLNLFNGKVEFLEDRSPSLKKYGLYEYRDVLLRFTEPLHKSEL